MPIIFTYTYCYNWNQQLPDSNIAVCMKHIPASSDPPRVFISQRRRIFMDFDVFRRKFVMFLLQDCRENLRSKVKNMHVYYNIIASMFNSRQSNQTQSISENNIIQHFAINQTSINTHSLQALISSYLRDLVQFQSFLNSQTQVSLPTQLQQAKANNHLSLVIRNRLLQFLGQMQHKPMLYDRQAVLHVDGLGQLSIDLNEAFNLKEMEQFYQSQSFDIIVQKANSQVELSLQKQPQKANIRLQLKEYFNAIQSSSSINTNNRNCKDDCVMTIKEFKPSTYKPFEKILLQLNQKYFQFLSEDAFSLCKQDGIYTSQLEINLMVEGSWFGFHQKPFQLCSTYINLSPQNIEWFFITKQDIPKLKQSLKQGTNTMNIDYNIQLDYINRQQWHSDVDWFVKKGIHIKTIVQNRGDFILIGSSTLFWYRSRGKTILLGFNSLPKSTLISNLKLYNRNQRASISNYIPLKSLLVKYIERQMVSIQQKALKAMRTHVSKWLAEQQIRIGQQQENICLEQVKQKYKPPFDSYCSSCQIQIFNFYSENATTNCIYCIACSTQSAQIHAKYNYKSLQSLLKYTQTVVQFQRQYLGCQYQAQTHQHKTYKLAIHNHINEQQWLSIQPVRNAIAEVEDRQQVNNIQNTILKQAQKSVIQSLVHDQPHIEQMAKNNITTNQNVITHNDIQLQITIQEQQPIMQVYNVVRNTAIGSRIEDQQKHIGTIISTQGNKHIQRQRSRERKHTSSRKTSKYNDDERLYQERQGEKNRSRQDRFRQDRWRQDRSRQYRNGQDRYKQDKSRQGRSRQDWSRQRQERDYDRKREKRLRDQRDKRHDSDRRMPYRQHNYKLRSESKKRKKHDDKKQEQALIKKVKRQQNDQYFDY